MPKKTFRVLHTWSMSAWRTVEADDQVEAEEIAGEQIDPNKDGTYDSDSIECVYEMTEEICESKVISKEEKVQTSIRDAIDYINRLMDATPDEATDFLTNNGEKVVDDLEIALKLTQK